MSQVEIRTTATTRVDDAKTLVNPVTTYQAPPGSMVIAFTLAKVRKPATARLAAPIVLTATALAISGPQGICRAHVSSDRRARECRSAWILGTQ